MLRILTTCYNAENYVRKCLKSIQDQSHTNFVCYITDDMSTDNTVDIIKEIIATDNRFILIENKIKLYQPGNYDTVIRNNEFNIDDNDVMIEVDGDDWLPDNEVFTRINNIYSDDDIWIANGRFIYSSGEIGFATEQKNIESIRNNTFTASHIRTWRAFLWRKIKVSDLKDNNGIYWQVAGDLSFMYPMLEMATNKHYKFMTDINYVYNETNPLNDHKVSMSKVNEIVNKIRFKVPYSKLIYGN